MPSQKDKKIKRRNPELSTGIGFFLFGVSAVAVLAFMISNETKFKRNGVAHHAEISRIQVWGNRPGGDRTYDVYAKYTVDGKEREVMLVGNAENIKVEVGQSVKIYYDPNNPGIVTTDERKSVLFWVLLFVSTFGIVGAVIIISETKKYLLKRSVLRSGDIVTAEFENVVRGPDAPNDEVPYIIQCKWTDAQGVQRILKSESLWSDPAPIIAERGIESFAVYMDMRDSERYYVYVDELYRDPPDE